MAQLTARTSTIFISAGDRTQVYRSVDEVPPVLRQKLIDCTRGINSATILIADKRGREELVRALQGRPSEVQCRLVDNLRSRQPDTDEKPENTAAGSNLASAWIWGELLLPLLVITSLWALLKYHL